MKKHKILRYLNSESRYDVILMISLRSHINKMIKKWESLNRSPKALQWMRCAATFVAKARDEIFDELEDIEGKRIKAMAEHSYFELRYTDAVVRQGNPDEPIYTVTVNEAGRDKIVEGMAQMYCAPCNGQDCSKCLIKDIYMAWDIPAVHEIVDDKVPCPYWCKDI